MNVLHKISGDTLIIVGHGSLDNETSNDYVEKVQDIIKESKAVILNFAEINYISSSGIQAIYNILDHLTAQGGKLVICNSNPDVTRIFRLVSLENDVPLFDSEDLAIDYFD